MNPFSTGELQAAYQMANLSGTTPFGGVEQAPLERQDAEHHRLQLRKERLQAGETPRALHGRIQVQLNRWLQPTQNTKEQMLNLLCLEQFVSGLPAHMQSWVRQHPGLTIQEAVNRAAAFQREQTPSHSSSNVNRETSAPRLLPKGHRKENSPETKEPPGKVRRTLWPSNSGKGAVVCFACGGLGHYAPACPQRLTIEGTEIEDSGNVLSSAVELFIKTFIFLDLETTGLAKDRPKVTELCLVAVHHTSLENPVWHTATGPPQLPRILDKLCLVIDPVKPVTPKAVEISGLNNYSIAKSEKPNFDEHALDLVQNFLQRQAQPVCLVAHNGYGFDFPLLKAELQLQGRELPGSVYCLDTLQALMGLPLRPDANPAVMPSSYKLPLLYRHFFREEPKDSHHAEGDVLTMLLVFLGKASELLEYAKTKARPWMEVPPMYTPRIPQTP